MYTLPTLFKNFFSLLLTIFIVTYSTAAISLDSLSVDCALVFNSDMDGCNPPCSTTSNSFQESLCTTSFGGDVQIKALYDGYQEVGDVVWLSRKSQKIKAKYFAYKQYGQSVIDRYNTWRDDKSIVAITSGAYGTGFNGQSDIPVGLTIDNGIMVNSNLDTSKDALVIVEAVGGIRMTNIEDARLTIQDNGSKVVDLNNYFQRGQFIAWAKTKEATVFQTHLLIQNNTLKVHYNSSQSRALRKVLVLSKSRSGEIFHVIYNLQNARYTLQEVANKILNHQKSLNMVVVMAANLDTGGCNVIGTGGGATDCQGKLLKGPSDRSTLTNALVYYYE